MISLLVIGCMVYACGSLVILYHWHGYLPGLTMVSAFPCHFLDSYGVEGSPFGFSNWFLSSLWLWVGTNSLEP